MNLASLVRGHAGERGDKIAIRCRDEAITYAELWLLIERIAGWLRELLALWGQGVVRPVVHATVPFDNAAEAHLRLCFRDDVRLLVPASKIHLVQKYVGAGEARLEIIDQFRERHLAGLRRHRGRRNQS